MESSLTREEKRKNKKKERKRKQRQAAAIARNEMQQEKWADNGEIDTNEEETMEVEAKRQKVDKPSENSSKPVVCCKCSLKDVVYFCEDCGKEYCANCYDSFHRELQKLKMEFHTNVVKVGGPEPILVSKDEETSRIDRLIERSGMIRSSTERVSPISTPSLPSPPQKQHNGLRCKKCFELLVRDDEFIYAGGKLYTNPQVLKSRHWDALHSRGTIVYCKHFHNVGRVVRATYANQGISFYKLQIEKTTWIENYVENPQFKDSDIIKEKQVGTTRPLMPCEVESLKNRFNVHSAEL